MNRRLIISLSLVSFTIGADEFALSPLLSLIGEDLSIPPMRAAWFVAAYALPLSLLGPYFGGLSDRIGRKRVLMPALFVFATGNLGLAGAASFETGVIWRLLAGAAAAGILSNVFAWIADAVPPKRQPGAMGFVQLGLTLGLILSPAAGAGLATLVGWRAVFVAIAGLALLAMIAISTLPLVARGEGPRASILDTLRRPGVAPALGVHALGLGVAIGCYALLGQLMQDRYAITPVLAGLVLGGYGMATVIGNTATGALTARLGGPAAAARLALAIVAVSVVGTFLFPVPVPLMLGLIAAWAVAGGSFAPSQQALLASLAGADRGRVLALAGSAMNLALAVTTTVGPVVYRHSGSMGVGALAALAFMLALLLCKQSGRQMEAARA